MTFEPLELLRLIHVRIDGPDPAWEPDDLELLYRVRDRASLLEPLRVRDKYASYLRGGLPSQSMPEHTSGSSEPPIPLGQAVRFRDKDGEPTAWFAPEPIDHFDGELNRRARRYTRNIAAAYTAVRLAYGAPTRHVRRTNLGDAISALDAAMSGQTWFVEKAEPVDRLTECSTEDCEGLVESGRKSGKCPKCRQEDSRARRREGAA